MKLYILITGILFSGCAVHHHHGQNTDIIIKEKSVRANLQWQHNVAMIIVHHDYPLSRKEKNIKTSIC